MSHKFEAVSDISRDVCTTKDGPRDTLACPAQPGLNGGTSWLVPHLLIAFANLPPTPTGAPCGEAKGPGFSVHGADRAVFVGAHHYSFLESGSRVRGERGVCRSGYEELSLTPCCKGPQRVFPAEDEVDFFPPSDMACSFALKAFTRHSAKSTQPAGSPSLAQDHHQSRA